GTFNFSDVPPGNYAVSVETARFAYDDQDIEVTANGTDDVTIDPDRGIVTGDVTAGGNTVNATVELLNTSNETVNSTTGSEFDFDVPIDGSYTLRVNAEGYDQVERSVEFGEESVALESSSETTESTGSLSGTVINTTSKDPIEGATIEAVDAEFSATTDSNGTYEIDGISPGEYTIVVSADGYADTERTVEVTTEGVEEDFELGAPASVSGVVTEENNESNTLGNATLTLLNSDNEEVETVTTDPDGAYTFDSLEEGGYRIEVSREGYQDETVRPINLSPGQSLTRDISLSPA
ncbi:MAG: carboxypeptidase regulatory-like domain protein, partial [uncultured archaeon A07HR67]